VRLEEQIAELEATIESCRKFILAGRIAVASGSIILIVMLLGGIQFNLSVIGLAAGNLQKEKAAQRTALKQYQKPPLAVPVPPMAATNWSVIRRTVAALNSPTTWAAIPCAAAIIIIIMPVVVRTANANVYAGRIEIDPLRLHGGSRSNCQHADKGQRNGCFQ
jgi:hypothetical protein